MDDPFAALMEEMACAQRGEDVDKSKAGHGGGGGGQTSAGAQKGPGSARRRPEPEPTPEERSIWRPDVEPLDDLLTFPHDGGQCYTATPDPAVEVQRQKLMGTLTVLFLNATKELKLDIRMPTLERWLISHTSPKVDPVLPGSSDDSKEARVGASLLFRELKEAGAGKQEARKLCARLGQAAGKALRQLSYKTSGAHGGQGGPKVTAVLDEASGAYSFRYKTTTLTLNTPHYHKLWRLFTRHAAREGEGEGDLRRRFRHHVFCLLTRYAALAGGTDRGGGMQGALNEDCFDVLLRYFDCRFECFASPLNSRYGRFCSAFPDLDMAFGSLGSFFHFRPTHGCYEANPPFVPCVIHRMARHMEALLDAASPHQRHKDATAPHTKHTKARGTQEAEGSEDEGEESGEEEEEEEERGDEEDSNSSPSSSDDDDGDEEEDEEDGPGDGDAEGQEEEQGEREEGEAEEEEGRPLCFIVVIPAWIEDRNTRVVQTASERPWKILRESKYCVRHVTCRAQEHGYCEGGQHIRPTRYKTSRFDTSVFFLQNDAARTKWPVTDQACEALLRAFSSKHEAETSLRREGKGKGKGVGIALSTQDEDEEDNDHLLAAIMGSAGGEGGEAGEGRKRMQDGVAGGGVKKGREEEGVRGMKGPDGEVSKGKGKGEGRAGAGEQEGKTGKAKAKVPLPEREKDKAKEGKGKEERKDKGKEGKGKEGREGKGKGGRPEQVTAAAGTKVKQGQADKGEVKQGKVDREEVKQGRTDSGAPKGGQSIKRQHEKSGVASGQPPVDRSMGQKQKKRKVTN